MHGGAQLWPTSSSVVVPAVTSVVFLAAAPPASAADGNLLPPFNIGETWSVCQGYSSAHTHTGTSRYGLDLTGNGCDSSASGRTVRVPRSGTIAYWQAAYGNLCVNFSGGSYTLTHINATQTSGAVTAGASVGTVAPAGARGNNGVAHIHFQIWSAPNCYNNSTIPFDSAHNARICGAPNMTATGPSSGNGVWSGTRFTGQSCGGGIGEGTFVRVTDNGEVYRVAGGAPLYVHSWNVFGGAQPTVAVSRSQLNSWRSHPADGTFVTGASSRRVYRFAGGAPHYVSTWNSFGGAKPTVVVDDFPLDRPDGASPLNHVRRYPLDGTFISNAADGRVYRVAGGAPLYVSSWANLGGPRPVTALDPWDFANFVNLRRTPSHIFVRGLPSNRVFRVVNDGHPYYVPSWAPYGGAQPFVDVDDWAIDNCDHLNCGPFGSLDSVVGGPGRVSVGGWSIDPNAVGTNTRIHVYVGGPPGSPGAEGHDAGVANVRRTDVAAVYPATGENHGFMFNIPTNKRGSQPVYVYAINVEGTKGTHVLLGQRSAEITTPKYAALPPSRILDTRTGLGAPKGPVGSGRKSRPAGDRARRCTQQRQVGGAQRDDDPYDGWRLRDGIPRGRNQAVGVEPELREGTDGRQPRRRAGRRGREGVAAHLDHDAADR